MIGLPFFSRAKQAVVVDAWCECGQLQSEHGSQLKKLPNGQLFRLYQQGSYCENPSVCPQFTWAEWATELELSETLLCKQQAA